MSSTSKDYRILKATKLAHLWLYHERYPGPKTASVGGMFLQGLETLLDPGGIFSGGMSKVPPEDGMSSPAWSSGALPRPAAGWSERGRRGSPRGDHPRISPGDPVLFEQKLLPGGLVPVGLPSLLNQMINSAGPGFIRLVQQLSVLTSLVKVESYAEDIWYANPPEGDRIGQGPPIGPPSHGLISGGPGPIPIPHSLIRFNDLGKATLMSGPNDEFISTVVVHYGLAGSR